MRNAERGTRNGFATLRYANKDNIYDKNGILARNKNVLGLKNALVWMLGEGKEKLPRGVY